ncbi:DNA mismatch repair endonuclease MutL [Borreliella garinii]|uniref:DNA mismatch repair endonuclease MutL n=1 Tax=Borreliella garinii TaxID=29519 RepID=UPI00018E263E|nr:DNA mismatch repair endonuclease MutL [Borreliella garinii]EED29609.1 DNA mismatch repair protein MutL [Borreliella garinii Far04]WNZ66443.1 DNA mismatch repair endonuclease MutL [Borreliella garinii]WNZ67439.1 DNA mismatch repair endonuclease MutL [Borreliella garinii]WNZ68436.1 DNA mismatch repair endonuclease MutL [Borreliella garinii]WNZ69435.1 DNA mismatch repair endonuclease MutL [Borreliella garinii]
MNKIRFLDKYLVQKIAAGESIDRPCSILRELLDNSIDSGATKIEVFLEEGGIHKILIIDNGSGISKEDLKICYLPHTTSKISSEEDLRKIETLGFRGEALSSIAICSNISITSSTTGNESYQIEVENGIKKCFKKQPAINGTIVNVTKIFHNFPARKRFLKQEPIETKMCLKVLEEKIITHPEINFEINLNQKLRKIYFKESLIDRVQNVYGNVIENNKFKVLKKEHENIKIELFLAPANFSKKSKRYIKTFVNRRPIDQKDLLEAITNGHSRIISPGNFPICYLFLEINPEYIDFNVHPQKKEVRFFNLPFLFKLISDNINNFFDKDINNYNEIVIKRQLTDDDNLIEMINQPKTLNQTNTYNITQNKNLETEHTVNELSKNIIQNDIGLKRYNSIIQNRPSFKENITNIFSDDFLAFEELQNKNEKEEIKFNYIGQIFSEFLIVEKVNEIYFIDQHAVHEKIIYEKLRNSKKTVQKLLIPIEFTIVDKNIEEIIDSEIEEYKKMDIIISKIGPKKYQLESIPNICNQYENTLINFFQSRKSRTINSLESDLYATIACRKAVKTNDILSLEFSKFLIDEFFKLEIKHCPHGRKIYYKISKFELEKKVARA